MSTSHADTGAVEADSGATNSDFIQRRRAEATALESELWDVLDEIPDPHIPVSLVEMAMIYDVTERDGHVTVEMSYPCMGCPAYGFIENDIKSGLRVVDGVTDVDIDVVWDPVWRKDMLTPDVREKMRNSGISL